MTPSWGISPLSVSTNIGVTLVSPLIIAYPPPWKLKICIFVELSTSDLAIPPTLVSIEVPSTLRVNVFFRMGFFGAIEFTRVVLPKRISLSSVSASLIFLSLEVTIFSSSFSFNSISFCIHELRKNKNTAQTIYIVLFNFKRIFYKYLKKRQSRLNSEIAKRC